jgi:hypothetical protein
MSIRFIGRGGSLRYFCALLGWNIVDGEAIALSGFFLVASYAIKVLSPKLAGNIYSKNMRKQAGKVADKPN